MTIEFSLRRRATQSRLFAVVYLSLAVIILVGSYFSLPTVAGKTLQSVNQIEESRTTSISPGGSVIAAGNDSIIHLHIFALIILILCISAVAFASYLLARSALIEVDLAIRFTGIADALCIAGNDFGQLEKAVVLLVPTSKYFSELQEKHLKTCLEIVKNVRG